MASATAPAPGAVLVLDRLHHSVTTEMLANLLEENKLEQGITWESAMVIKRLQHQLSLPEACYDGDSANGYEQVDFGVDVGQSGSYDTGSKEFEDQNQNEDDNQLCGSRSISSISEAGSGEATTEEESLREDGEACNNGNSHSSTPPVVNAEFYHRGFITCCGVHTAQYILHSVHGLKLAEKELDIKVADGEDLEELRQFEAAQMIPKLLISCINQRTPQLAMRLYMVKDLLRGIKWALPVGIERVPRTVENLSAGTQFLLTPQSSEETQELLHLLREVNFLEFKVTANLQQKDDRKGEKEVKDSNHSSASHCKSWATDSGAEESGLGTSRSRSNSEGDPSMSCFDTSASSSSAFFNCTSAHIVPRTATAYLSPQTALTCLPLRFLLPETFAKALIGDNQHTIKWIAEKSGASIAVLEKQFFIRGNNWFDKMVVLFGSDDSYQIALTHVLEVLTQEASRLLLCHRRRSCDNTGSNLVKELTHELVDDDGRTIFLRIVAFNSITGRLIGKFGKNLKDVMTATNTKITISGTPYTWNEPRTDADRIVLIFGRVENVLEACYLVTRRLSNAFTYQFKSTGYLPGEAMPMACVQTQKLQNLAPPNIFVQYMPVPQPQPAPAPIPVPVSLGGSQSSLGLYNSQSPSWMNILPPTHVHTFQPICSAMNKGGAVTELCGAGASPIAFQQRASTLPSGTWNRHRITRSSIYCPVSAMGTIIGPQDSNLQYIRAMTGVNVEVNAETLNPKTHRPKLSSSSDEKDGEPVKQVVLAGNFPNHIRAQLLIFNLVHKHLCNKSMATENEKENQDLTLITSDTDVRLTIEFSIPSKYAPRVIGQGGAKLTKVQNATSTNIQLGTAGYIRGKTFDNNVVAVETKVKICGAFNGIRSAQAKILSEIETIASSEEQESQVAQMQSQLHLQHFQQVHQHQQQMASVTQASCHQQLFHPFDASRRPQWLQLQQLDQNNNTNMSVRMAAPTTSDSFMLPRNSMTAARPPTPMPMAMNSHLSFLPPLPAPSTPSPMAMYGQRQ